MRKWIIFLLVAVQVKAQKPDIPTVSEDLLKGANAVILKEQTAITVEKTNKVFVRKYRLVAILNKQGEAAFDTYIAYYDAFRKVRKLEAAAYNTRGELLLKSRNSDIRDVAVNPFDYSATDIRVKTVSLDRKHLGFPYILEFISEEESSETFFYEDWTPVPSLQTAVVESTFQIKSPVGIGYRARTVHLAQPSVATVEGGWKTETWKLENFNALSSERFLAPGSLPRVAVAPLHFQIDKYTGTVSSWKDIGDFYLRLNRGRDVLPEATREKIREVIGAETDTLEKAKRVYRFMQGHTRYFNISFRLGGWQSLPASVVAEKGYGDCKALTNYTLALLKEAGVNAYPALVNAGERIPATETDDFPQNTFNHIIACIPTARDTVWLECTSQTSPFGYLGSFTGNRKALLITEETSRLVNTRSYGSEENTLVSSVEIKLEKDGSAEVRYGSVYRGIRQEEAASLAGTKDKEKQKRWLTAKVRLSDIVWDEFLLETIGEEVSETGRFKAPVGGSFSGERFFFQPYVLTSFFPEDTDKVTGDREFYLNPNLYAFTEEDTVTVNIPAGFVLENKPRDVYLETRFGSYTSQVVEIQPGMWRYIRKVVIDGGRYPGETRQEWSDFTRAVNRADRQRTVLRKTL